MDISTCILCVCILSWHLPCAPCAVCRSAQAGKDKKETAAGLVIRNDYTLTLTLTLISYADGD